MQNIYISRVVIKNFRNFKDIDVILRHKGVIIGENNIGKTNFLRALQLILDDSLSEKERILKETDFNDSIVEPMKNKEKIFIRIYIEGFSENKIIMSAFGKFIELDENGKESLYFTYTFSPYKDCDENVRYRFNVYKGENEADTFDANDRKCLNMRVIKAFRSLENDMVDEGIGSINKMLEKYLIDKKQFEKVAKIYKKGNDELLKIDEIVDLTNSINKYFGAVLKNDEFKISFGVDEIDPNKVLSTIKLLMRDRSTSDMSLGLNNILYISIMLQMFQEKTIPTLLKGEKYRKLRNINGSEILELCYDGSNNGNYILKNDLEERNKKKLYRFMKKQLDNGQNVTILAIEEIESHLHPVNQRFVYNNIIRESETSVLLTTHSTYITAIAPFDEIIHLRKGKENATVVHSTAELQLRSEDVLDIQNYLDVKKGEIYFGKAVLLVEGTAEEYLIPKFARIYGKPLEEKGIILCSVGSANFYPFVKILKNLKIPYAIITDGDPYIVKENEKFKRKISSDEEYNRKSGYFGTERVRLLLKKIGVNLSNNNPKNIAKEIKKYQTYGIFMNKTTLEIEILKASKSSTSALKVLSEVIGDDNKVNEKFLEEIRDGNFYTAFNKIKNKKRLFAQKLAKNCKKSNIPKYIKQAIDYIYEQV